MEMQTRPARRLLYLYFLLHLCRAQSEVYLAYLNLTGTGVESVSLPTLDDGISGDITIADGLPFGVSHPISVWIANNGIFSFNEPYSHWNPEVFPGISSSVVNGHLVAPYWDDVDISGEEGGSIYYQVHTSASGNPGSVALLNQVNDFIQSSQGNSFNGVWMVVAMWDQVHPFPHGSDPDSPFYLDINEVNSYQALVITDHTTQTYAVFIYKCGDLNWARGPTIGFNAGNIFYENYILTGSPLAHTMDCNGQPDSDYFTLVYNITASNFVSPPPPPTSLPPQESYLEWIEMTGINPGQLLACDDCSSDEITLPISFPFGNYFHNSLYMSTNGIISFGVDFPHFQPSLFPTESASTYYDYAVAPYWADHDARLYGTVSWEFYSVSDGVNAGDIISRVNQFVNTNTNETDFTGSFVFVGNWVEMHPYPAGASQGQAEPYLTMNNTYQAVLVTNGINASYAIFTYNCDSLNWANEATIGFNAAGDYYANHPLSGTALSAAIACVHSSDSEWNNEIYNLVPEPNQLTQDTTPIPPLTIGTCGAAGYNSCCVMEGPDDFCTGQPQDCYCDTDCFLFNDCCSDVTDICTFELPEGDYLLFASHSTINHIDLNGNNFNIFISHLSGGAYGIDFHHSAGYMYWSDYVDDVIYRANLTTGLDRVPVVNETIPEPEDLAVDWISNKLYWVDALWARVEVMDIASGRRTELIRTSNHSIPRGLAVDPVARYIFWTDWGEPSLIERASMDGKGRIVLVSDEGINLPLGITCDYTAQRIYWSDSGLETISYAFYDGSGRSDLITAADGVAIPFDLTIFGDLLYWTDWFQNSVYGTHKLHGTDPIGNFTDIIPLYVGLPVNPNGIEAVSSQRQPSGVNYCLSNTCEHICLLSSVEAEGRSCVCETGYILNDDLTSCSPDPNPTVVPTNNGSCQASGYTACCEVGYCGGYPANCFCDVGCYGRGDCCSDINSTCTQAPGSCLAAGYDTCCDDGFCLGYPETANCYCDPQCLTFNDCCEDFQDICPDGEPTIPPASFGSCVAAGYNVCCSDTGGDCVGSDPFDCYCDVFCYYLNDCCSDIDIICSPPVLDDDTQYLLFANHFFINKASLDGSGLSILLTLNTGGAVGVQYLYQQNLMFYTDYVSNHIYSASLDTGGDVELLLNDSVEVPEDLAVDWVGNNLYWTDSFWARIEVMDLDTRERAELVRTGNHSVPRAIVVDPVTKYMYWTDWGEVAKVEKAGMDGKGRTVLIDTVLMWPNGLALDYTTQIIYWADAFFDKIEYASAIDGSGRTLLETQEMGLLHPYSLTIDGNLLYWSDWQNNSIFATHKFNGNGTGGDISTIVDYLVFNPNGIKAVGPDKQPPANNPCEDNDCTHLCLLSVVDPRGYSCACPLGFDLHDNGLECIMNNNTTPIPEFGSCRDAGYTKCCETGYCAGYPANCYCDQDCHGRGDCCYDTNEICEDYDSYIIFANHYFVNRCNLDGSNPVNLLIQTSGGVSGIEFDLAPNQEKMFFADFVTNQILMANLSGEGSPVPIMQDDLEVPEGLAYDWIGHNLYWTDSFWARIEVLDLNSTERAEVLRTGAETTPRGIAVDPNNRVMYWTDWGAVAKVEKASMDGNSRVILAQTDLAGPYGITIDYIEQKIYWVDGILDKIEFCNPDGTGRTIVTTSPPGYGLGIPYSLALEGEYLYWSEWEENSLFRVEKTGGNVSQILSGLLVNPNGIEVVSTSNRVYSSNPCQVNGCTHLCLLSSSMTSGYSCACPLGMRLESDGVSCVEEATDPPTRGLCGDHSRCCEAGYCAGYPPTCFCDHDCHSRGDCCSDIDSVCPEFEGSCVAANYTTCCSSGLCFGVPDDANCYCDINCLGYGDCCPDFYTICPEATPAPTTTTSALPSITTSTSSTSSTTSLSTTTTTTSLSTSTSTSSMSTTTASSSTSTSSSSTSSSSSSTPSSPAPPSAGSRSSNGGRAAAVAVPIILIVVLAVVGVLVAFLFFWRKRIRKSYDIFGDNNITYDRDNESISLPGGAGAGAAPTNKEKLVFEDETKIDLGSETSSSILSSDTRHLQNPLYAAAAGQFNPLPPPNLSDDRTHYNPLYDAIPSNPRDNSTTTTTTTSADDLPEKTLPSPEDFLPPQANTNPMKSGTESTSLRGDNTYEVAKPVPIELETGPPLYATVIPKHKRATAKPFAKDGADSDDDEC